jgi:hypothetical protein
MISVKRPAVIGRTTFPDPRQYRVGKNRGRLRLLALDVLRAIEDGADVVII